MRRKAITWSIDGVFHWALRNKLQWNSYKNKNIFCQENTCLDVVYEMAAALPQPKCVNKTNTVWSLYSVVKYNVNLHTVTTITPVNHRPYFEFIKGNPWLTITANCGVSWVSILVFYT